MNDHIVNTKEQWQQVTSFDFSKNPGKLNDNFAGFFYRADIWLDAHLHPISKNLLMEIYSLERLPLGCIASNEHFAETLNIGSRTVSRYIKELLNNDYLILEDFDGNRRKLRVNLDRLEPRQIGEPGSHFGEESRQFDQEACHFGEPSSPKWRHTNITYYNQLKSISREELSFKNFKSKKLSKPAQAQVQEQSQLLASVMVSDPKGTSGMAASKIPKPKNKAKNKCKVAQTGKVVAADIPLPFASEIFKTKWGEWLAYRKEIKKPYKSPRAIRQIFAQLARFEEAFVLELVDTSMANEWRGLVFPRTGELYEQWLQKQALAKEKQGTGTRAKPQPNLIAATNEANSIYHQLKLLEKQQDTFETYPVNLLEPIAHQLRGMWKRAKAVGMQASEIERINTLGQKIAGLIKTGNKTKSETKSSNTSQTKNIKK